MKHIHGAISPDGSLFPWKRFQGKHHPEFLDGQGHHQTLSFTLASAFVFFPLYPISASIASNDPQRLVNYITTHPGTIFPTMLSREEVSIKHSLCFCGSSKLAVETCKLRLGSKCCWCSAKRSRTNWKWGALWSWISSGSRWAHCSESLWCEPGQQAQQKKMTRRCKLWNL
jgi:hypothetical protein